MYLLILFLTSFPYLTLILENVLHIPQLVLLIASYLPLIHRRFHSGYSERSQHDSCCCLDVLLPVLMTMYFVACKIRKVRHFMYLYLYFGFVLLTTSICVPIFAWRPFNVVNLGLIVKLWKKTFQIFGVNVKVIDRENLTKNNGPQVYVSNHQSSLDLIPMAEVLPRDTTALAKKELVYLGSFGIAAWLSGIIFVDRANHTSAINTMKRVAEIMMQKKANIWIFPEGTRSMKGSMLPFKKGAFHLAVGAQIPIVPVVFSNYKSFFDHEHPTFEKGEIVATCLEPVSTKGLTTDDVDNLIQQIRDKMLRVFHKNDDPNKIN